jgi:hypothetical protein
LDVGAAIFHDELAEVEDVHGAVGAELDVDGSFEEIDEEPVIDMEAAGGEVLGVADEVFDFSGVEVDACDLVAGGALCGSAGGGEGSAVAEEGDEGVAAVFSEGGGGGCEVELGSAGEGPEDAEEERAGGRGMRRLAA